MSGNDGEFCDKCNWSLQQQHRLDTADKALSDARKELAEVKRKARRPIALDRAIKGECNGERERALLDRTGELRALVEAGEPLTCTEIAVLLGISREAVRLIEIRALRKVRRAIEAWEKE